MSTQDADRDRRDGPDVPIWARPEPGQRRAQYTRDQIAAVALAIADAEGFEAVSMRRVAKELGAGTMTLYHYVRNKEDLLALVDDAIMGEVLVPEGEMPDNWRDALREIAHRSREVFRRHPWRAGNLGEAQGGPNSVRHFDQSLAAVEGTGLSERDRLEIIALVDDYVLGNSIRQTEVELPAEDWATIVGDYLGDMLGTGEFKQVEKLLAGDSPEEMIGRVMNVMFDPTTFDRGLERLLDGIELFVNSKGKKR